MSRRLLLFLLAAVTLAGVSAAADDHALLISGAADLASDLPAAFPTDSHNRTVSLELEAPGMTWSAPAKAQYPWLFFATDAAGELLGGDRSLCEFDVDTAIAAPDMSPQGLGTALPEPTTFWVLVLAGLVLSRRTDLTARGPTFRARSRRTTSAGARRSIRLWQLPRAPWWFAG